MKINAVFYSMSSHIYRMAEAIVGGVREVEGSQVELLQVPELIAADVLEKSGAITVPASSMEVAVSAHRGRTNSQRIIFGAVTSLRLPGIWSINNPLWGLAK